MKPNPKLDAIVRRPVKQVALFSRGRPKLWREHDRLRAELKSKLKYPDWCYAPSAVSIAALYPGATSITLQDVGLAQIASALAAWRTTKGIYLFDPTIFECLWATPIAGDLPVELLQRLPEWCVYVPFPSPRALNGPPDWVSGYGFFAHLESHSDGAPRLLLTLDVEDGKGIGTNIIPLKLAGNLSECCTPIRTIQDIDTDAKCALYSTTDEIEAYRIKAKEWQQKQETDLIRPLLSILLWLCSANPEITGLDPLRGFRAKKTKKGLRNFGPDEPRVYEVAYRIGSALRLDRAAMARGVPGDGSHASPRPHIRRAHWHAFWTGPKASISKARPADRKLVLKWIAPIAVCVGTDDPVIPTVHPVRGDENERMAG